MTRVTEVECDLCEEEIAGIPHRWHVRDGSTIALCSRCLARSFEELWEEHQGLLVAAELAYKTANAGTFDVLKSAIAKARGES
jgi:ribosome-binding protein aMBF1 (putative translation factor)